MGANHLHVSQVLMLLAGGGTWCPRAIEVLFQFFTRKEKDGRVTDNSYLSGGRECCKGRTEIALSIFLLSYYFPISVHEEPEVWGGAGICPKPRIESSLKNDLMEYSLNTSYVPGTVLH